jgi:hypothetical protein
MPVLRLAHLPTRFASGGWLTLPSGAVQPVNAPEAPTIPLAPRPYGLCLSLSRALGAQLAVACVIVLSSATSRQQRKGAGQSSLPEGRGDWLNEDERTCEADLE